jgi:hypothetical protein
MPEDEDNDNELVFTDDIAVLDRYQAFSAEMLRLSLGGVAGVAFLITLVAGDKTQVPHVLSGGTKTALAVALLAFGIGAASALGHRYWSTDSMASHIRLLRIRTETPQRDAEISGERRARKKAFRRSGRMIAVSAISIAAGAVALVTAFLLIISTIPSKPAPSAAQTSDLWSPIPAPNSTLKLSRPGFDPPLKRLGRTKPARCHVGCKLHMRGC